MSSACSPEPSTVHLNSLMIHAFEVISFGGWYILESILSIDLLETLFSQSFP